MRVSGDGSSGYGIGLARRARWRAHQSDGILLESSCASWAKISTVLKPIRRGVAGALRALGATCASCRSSSDALDRFIPPNAARPAVPRAFR